MSLNQKKYQSQIPQSGQQQYPPRYQQANPAARAQAPQQHRSEDFYQSQRQYYTTTQVRQGPVQIPAQGGGTHDMTAPQMAGQAMPSGTPPTMPAMVTGNHVTPAHYQQRPQQPGRPPSNGPPPPFYQPTMPRPGMQRPPSVSNVNMQQPQMYASNTSGFFPGNIVVPQVVYHPGGPSVTLRPQQSFTVSQPQQMMQQPYPPTFQTPVPGGSPAPNTFEYFQMNNIISQPPASSAQAVSYRGGDGAGYSLSSSNGQWIEAAGWPSDADDSQASLLPQSMYYPQQTIIQQQPQQQVQPQPQPPRPTSNSGSMPAPQSTYKPPKRKAAIQICDPTTGNDVTEEILHGKETSSSNPTPSTSGTSSARATPPTAPQPPDKRTADEIHVQYMFASQVAATLVTDQKADASTKEAAARETAIAQTDAAAEVPAATPQQDATRETTPVTEQSSVITPETSTKDTESSQSADISSKMVPKETSPVTDVTAEPSTEPATEEKPQEEISSLPASATSIEEDTEVQRKTPSPVVEAPLDAKDQRKKNGKRRQRELNKKGDAKVGGDDLEAFRVKEPGTDNQGETSGKPNEVEILQKEEIKVPEKDGPCDGISSATVDAEDRLGNDDVDATPPIVNDGDVTVQKQTTPEPVGQEEVVEPAPQVISIEAPPSGVDHVPELIVETQEVVTAPVAEPTEPTPPPSVPTEASVVAEEKDVNDVVKTEEVRVSPEPAEPTVVVSSEPPSEANAVVDQPTVNHVDAAITQDVVENEVNGEVEMAELQPTEDNKEKMEVPVMTKPQLKYDYKEDQWSPLHPDRKKQYDRAFLLQFQWVSHCMQKPDGLPNIEIVKDQAHKPKDMNMRNIGSMNRGYGPAPPDFTPGFIKPSPSGRGSMGHRRPDRPHGDQGGRRPPQGVKIISVSASFKEEVKLHSAEKAWKPVHKDKKDVDPEEQKTEELYRRFRGILNKLTPQKFQTLVQQVIELDIDTEERLKGVIDLVFEKAISEPNFSVAYATMCKCLQTIRVQATGSGGGKETNIVNFRKLLLNRCQKEFEKDKSDELEWDKRQQEIDASTNDDERKRLTEELQIDIVRARRRSLGNIRFIGELFKLRILTEVIMHDCIVRLLKDSADEDSLECLCKLMMTIGKELDNPKNKPRIDQYVQQLQGILQAKKISSRVRFMIQDVIDLRMMGWVPRRDENNPKTIDQIHKEAQREEEAMHQALAQVQVQNKRPDDRRRQPAPRMQQPTGAEDGWTAVPTKGSRAIDPSKLKITKPSIDENIQLGPGGSSRPAWVKGSSGGTKASTPESERPSTPANRFSALSQGPVEKEPPAETRRSVSGRLSSGRPEQKAAGRYPPQPQRKMSAPPMTAPMREREHEQAIANVRKFTGGPGSRSQSRENSRTREHEVREKPAPIIVNKDISVEEMEKKTTAIIDEFLHINDYTEAEKCFEELKHATGVLHIFVSTALNNYLERSAQARNHVATLLRNIIKKGNLPVTTYIKGLAEVLEFADDMSIDIPHIWTYLGELIGPMVQDGTVPFTFLREPFAPLVVVNKAGGLMAEVLHKASSVVGHNKVAELWKASGLKWAEFLNKNMNESDWLRQQKLSFTVQQGEPQSPPVPISVETISSELTSLLRKRADNEEVFDWIETHVEEPRTKSKEFIRCLMKAVCFSAISGDSSQAKVNVEELKMRVALLHKFLENKEDRELQALFAVQALVNELSHPAGLFRDIIDTLYDDEVISEDAFCQWEHNDDPAEQEGRAIALKSAAQFFTWLHQTEKDES